MILCVDMFISKKQIRYQLTALIVLHFGLLIQINLFKDKLGML